MLSGAALLGYGFLVFGRVISTRQETGDLNGDFSSLPITLPPPPDLFATNKIAYAPPPSSFASGTSSGLSEVKPEISAQFGIDSTSITNSIPSKFESLIDTSLTGILVTDQSQIESLLSQMKDEPCKYGIVELWNDGTHIDLTKCGTSSKWEDLRKSLKESDPGYAYSVLDDGRVLSILNMLKEKDHLGHGEALFQNEQTWRSAVSSVFHSKQAVIYAGVVDSSDLDDLSDYYYSPPSLWDVLSP